MAAYLFKRILLIIPTMLGIMLLNFIIVQVAPGGPIEQVMAELSGSASSIDSRVGGGSEGIGAQSPADVASGAAGANAGYRGSQGLDPELIKELEKQFGFDKPPVERFLHMLWNYATFDFGRSYFQGRPVIDLIWEKLPVSISLGVWMVLLTYLISIPLGIRKAVQDGSPFDVWTSGVLVVGYALPGFMVGVFLLVVFAGGSYFQWFPSSGLGSDNWAELSTFDKILDYLWHLVLPLTALAIGSFTTLAFLTKNSFLDEIRKQYVLTARSKGLTQNQVLYGHVFRNAMLIIIAGFPGAFITAFFTG
ncbi:MAG: ABC transporter permease subunit, partial [Hyphomicrobiaceae bacterium]|nr:ABC transporter permease subunit [Hyphomicrobiaceae bacterium]